MSKRWWPVSISGACGVFAAGLFAGKYLSIFLAPSIAADGPIIAVVVYLLLHHAAETARDVPVGTYTRGWFGIRRSTSETETTVSPVSEKQS